MQLVHNTDPYNTQGFVPIDKEIKVLFKRDLNEKSLKDNVQLIEMDTERFVEIDIKYHRRKLYITPKKGLKGDEKYYVVIRGGKDGIETILQEKAATDYTFEFKTRESAKIKKPIILSPINETKYSKFPKIVLKTEMQDSLDYYVVQVSRNNSFNKIIWSEKIRNIYSEKVVLHPELKDPIERFYIRAIGVGFDREEKISSDPIQIYIREQSPLEIPSLPEPEDPKDEVRENKVVSSTMELGDFIELDKLKNIYLLFDEEIDESSVNRSSIYITKEEN